MLLKSYPTIITHSVSAGALLCDATEANAFIAPTGIDFTPYRGKQIEIWSGSTLWARAWVSASEPAGESLGSELIVVPDFSTWPKSSGVSVSGGIATFDGSSGDQYLSTGAAPNNIAIRDISKLYRIVFAVGTVSGGSCKIYDNSGINYTSPISSPGTFTLYSSLTTFPTNACGINSTNTNFNGSVTSASVKQVTSPARTGALLLSSNGGSRGWAYKHASFNPNAAVTLRILARRIASGNGGYYK